MNALLSFVYTLLVNDTVAALEASVSILRSDFCIAIVRGVRVSPWTSWRNSDP
jgi:hypothetical protein